MLSYHTTDLQPYPGVSYYRLKQTGMDEYSVYSDLVTVQSEITRRVLVYPNPARNKILIEGSQEELEVFAVFNSMGQEFTSLVKEKQKPDKKLILNVSSLPPGIYLIKTKSSVNRIQKY